IIFDERHRSSYPWGTALPGVTPRAWLDSGYIKKFDSLDALARACKMEPTTFVRAIERFNGFARKGVDEDFGRGVGAYHHYYGDPNVKPNPCLGTIEKAPFYAITLYPGDVGTSGGIMTDEYARALRDDGSVLPGLYATGNCTASVMGRRYIGAGA